MAIDCTEVLVRDNFRCMVSGRIDQVSADAIEELGRELEINPREPLETHCAYVFAESANSDIGNDVKV